jgi:branched-subunit amino acid transport protein
MKPIVKKILPFVGVAALTALGTLGIMKKDTLLYKLYQKSYKHQIKKENITPYN